MGQQPFTMPGSDLDLQDPDAVADLLHETAALNRDDPRRNGSTLHLPRTGQLLVTGDLHDNAPNLQRVIKRARLERAPDNLIVLHELIHGPTRLNGKDLSIRTLARACAVKRAHPEQVLFLLSNHELAQRRQEHVFKDGGSDVDAFNDGLVHLFGDAGAEQVHAAFDDYVDSLALAVRCENGVMVAHSLPGPRKLDGFDPSVLDRELTEADVGDNGSATLMVWGRRQDEQVATQLGEAWGVKAFILGHQPPEMGWEEVAHNILIITSEHGHGMCLPLDLTKDYERDDLFDLLVPINGIRL